MIEKEKVSYMEGTPVSVRVYDVDRYAPHYHEDCIEVLFVLKGEIDILSTYDRFHMGANDFTVINKGDVHYIKGRGENLVLSLYMDLSRFEERHEFVQYIYFLCESFNVNDMQEKYIPEIRSVITDITLEAAKAKGRDIALINEKATELMDILVDRYDLANYSSGREIPESQRQRYYRIVKIIDTRYGEKLEISDLARQEYMGKNYISQFWKNLTGMNLTDYITSVRTERAERMMLTTDKNINEVALNCGFSDTKYIYKGFRKWYEKTPSQHKKEYERYEAEGTKLREYSGEEFLERFGRPLIYAGMDESKAKLIRDGGEGLSWRDRYEIREGRYAGSKIKREMIEEQRLESGLKEIYIPLLDRNVVGIDGDSISMDMDFIEMVLMRVKKMSLILYIEVRYREHTPEEWERIIEYFIHAVGDSGKPGLLSRCRFLFCFDELTDAPGVKKLVTAVSGIVGAKNVKMALKFD